MVESGRWLAGYIRRITEGDAPARRRRASDLSHAISGSGKPRPEGAPKRPATAAERLGLSMRAAEASVAHERRCLQCQRARRKVPSRAVLCPAGWDLLKRWRRARRALAFVPAQARKRAHEEAEGPGPVATTRA